MAHLDPNAVKWLFVLALSVCSQVISCRLIFDIIKTLVERFAKRDIELLHHITKGFTLDVVRHFSILIISWLH